MKNLFTLLLLCCVTFLHAQSPEKMAADIVSWMNLSETAPPVLREIQENYKMDIGNDSLRLQSLDRLMEVTDFAALGKTVETYYLNEYEPEELKALHKFYKSSAGRAVLTDEFARMARLGSLYNRWSEAQDDAYFDIVKNSGADMMKIEIEDDCMRFRSGTFESDLGNGKFARMIRDGNGYQEERVGEEILRLDIEWTDNNTYVLYDLDENGQRMGTNIIEVTIVRTDGYTYEYVVGGAGRYYYGTIRKLNEKTAF